MTYRSHAVGVVVPAYDEAGLVGDVLRAVPPFVDRVYAVDDASTDGTLEEIRAVARETATRAVDDGGPSPASEGGLLAARVRQAERFGRTTVLCHRHNLGAGGAVKTGYLAAMGDGVDLVATIDGDGQMDPRLLPRFLDPVVDGEVDYAKGNRLHGRRSREMSRFRLLGNVLLTLLTRLASGYWGLVDSQNGYTVVTRDALDRVDVATLYEYYGYPNDLLTRLGVTGARVVDVPHDGTYGAETSHIDYLEYVPRVSWLLLRSFWWRLRALAGDRTTMPVVVTYGCSVGAVASGGLLAVHALAFGTGGPWRGRVATVALSFAAAVVLLGIAVRLDAAAARRGRRTVTVADVGSERR